jgi:hypothetical protein
MKIYNSDKLENTLLIDEARQFKKAGFIKGKHGPKKALGTYSEQEPKDARGRRQRNLKTD